MSQGGNWNLHNFVHFTHMHLHGFLHQPRAEGCYIRGRIMPAAVRPFQLCLLPEVPLKALVSCLQLQWQA